MFMASVAQSRPQAMKCEPELTYASPERPRKKERETAPLGLPVEQSAAQPVE